MAYFDPARPSETLCAIADCSTPPFDDISLLICHELRTPLASIQGALKLLGYQQSGSLSDDGQKLLTIAINNADRLTRLANALEHQPTPLMTLLSSAELERLQLENDLHQAMEQGAFYLAYQPIVAMEHSCIVGVEALARWRHSQRGDISPEVFIPLAEKAGLIDTLGLFFLDQACQQLRQWQLQFPAAALSVSVNLSAVQLRHPQLVERVSETVKRHHIAPSSLKLEVTESALIENKELALAALVELRQLGIQLYIDDFGTGYSSLGRLQDLPFDTLKIDRSFIRNKNWAMSEAIFMLAERLQLDVIVEGVETLADLTVLRELGYNKMQGYYFSQPIDSVEVAYLLMRQALEGRLSFAPERSPVA
ncbi:EAL domain-containing protein [Nodosilinea sp. PGN35]|uniref:putative bifunctional diguanylate cyclase/phosphodiesterase n=1 Tax=Nodosilinea sp. PGN35 TaxID=3020489 RepID=UPI0023B22CA2|nr:EAL domain-containing protein [Nodosilinea sp. TSF1-S3]MDF0364847.1 EAL domain-containing protein [Nodosilinea sp. TSF1-S3]